LGDQLGRFVFGE